MSPLASEDTSDSSPPIYRTEFQQLMSDIRENRESGVEELFSRYQPYILRLAEKYLDSDIRPKVSGSDIVQASVLEACEGLREFTGTTEQEFRFWLRRIVVNNILNEYRFWSAHRRSADRLSVSLDHDAAKMIVDEHPGPRTSASRREEESLILEKLHELPEEHRIVIELRNREGLSFRDIATHMNRSEDAARMLWARAMQALAAKLKDKNS